jgi:hypothetical protein
MNEASIRNLVRGILKEYIEEQTLEEDNLVSKDELEEADEETIDELG